MSAAVESPYAERLQALHATKVGQARRKREVRGAQDSDEQGMVVLPEEAGELVEAVSGSGVAVKDLVLKGFEPIPNHPSGGFFGAKAVGANFRRLLEAHPTHIDPLNTMAGVYMVNFNSYRRPGWPPELDYSHLHRQQQLYGIDSGIGGVQHFCPDLRIGLELGWGGLLDRVRHYRQVNPEAAGFYDGLEDVILGVQGWVRRHGEAARELADAEPDTERQSNLLAVADICERQVNAPPETFREACQWLVFFQAVAKMYNGSGEWGQLDELLRPYHERDCAGGRLTDDEAILHLACLLLSETAYIQLGGPDADGRDLTSRVSFLILEAVHRVKAPANIGVRVGEGLSRDLFRRGLEILFEDRMGFPKFVGDRACTEGFARNGYPVELGRQRIYAGCHWLAIPGREYCMADMVKVDLARVFDVALKELTADETAEPTTDELWKRFERHLARAVEVIAEGIDFHLDHMHEVFPELFLDLFCYGPVEKGLDASHGGVEFTNIGVDAASLATAADSFAAIEQRVERENRLTWRELTGHLADNWSGPEGERARRMLRNIPRFGSGGSLADEWALRISQTFTDLVKRSPTPKGVNMIPGLFSWAKVIALGQGLGATPNGRRAGEPVSHGPNPEPGFNEGHPGTPTQLAAAVAAVQPGYGNTAPLQLDLDPGLGRTAESLDRIEALIRTHFELGGTMVNINVLDKDTLLAAQEDPERFPDLLVRVTGFSAYFASLSPEMRRLVVERFVQGDHMGIRDIDSRAP
ncbi:MAG: formate acetyltransferase [Armatimonadetes bacterium]|nr:formate acetyltransferase [Armatimonadota bacterium]